MSAKSSKKPPPHATRPISDFFTRKSAAQSTPPSKAQPPAPQPNRKPLKPRTPSSSNPRVPALPEQQLGAPAPAASLSVPRPPARVVFDIVEIPPSPNKTPRRAPSLKQRTQSLDSVSSNSMGIPNPPSSPRKDKVGSDIDMYHDPSVYPTPLVTPQIQKKAQPATKRSIQSSATRFVASSQSPSELSLPEVRPAESKQDLASRDVDMAAPSNPSSPRPSSPLSAPPSSPERLDPATKAARIIAEIKAKAYAATRSGSPSRAFNEVLSDSDDEGLFSSLAESKERNSGPRGRVQKANLPVTSTQVSKPYALRNREVPRAVMTSPTPPPLPSKTSRQKRGASTHLSAPITQSTQGKKGKGKAYNPLDDLLKEKRTASKIGVDEEAIRRAEAAARNRDAWLRDSDDEDFDRAASSSMNENEEVALDDNVRRRLFGEEQGKVIEDMLAGDKAKRVHEMKSEKVAGVPLWEAASDDSDLMDVDAPTNFVPTINYHQDPILSRLQHAVERKDFTQATLFLSSGPLNSLKLSDFPDIIPYLCELALFSDTDIFKTACSQCLTHIWDTTLLSLPKISFSLVLSALARLGAKSSVLQGMEWDATAKPIPISGEDRNNTLYRLALLLTSAARTRQLVRDEIPDILMAFILITNDPSTSAQLQRAFILAIDCVCQSIASGADISAEIESRVCTKILKYAMTLEPINKLSVVSLLGSCTGRAKRIARSIAHGIITDAENIGHESYGDLPDLSPVLAQLQQANRVGSKFEYHDNADFVDMASYVQILGIALTNIPGYVMEERKIVTSEKDERGEKMTLLRLIRTNIEALHGRISDIRATHLDRSRAKAALKGLSLRIYYQRTSAQKNASTLHSYFGKDKKPKSEKS